MNTAIILAGGIGTRLGGEKPKQYLDVAGKPVICYCLDKFQNSSIIDEIIIVASVETDINGSYLIQLLKKI